MALSRPSMSSPLPVLVVPLRGRQPLLADRHPAAAVFVTEPERCASVPGRRLVELFGLTPARRSSRWACSRASGWNKSPRTGA